MVGNYIRQSSGIKGEFNTKFINLMTSSSLDDIGKGRLGKLLVLLKIQMIVIKSLLVKRYDLCYVTLNAKGPAFYKDLLVVSILKLFRMNIVYHFHNKGVEVSSKGMVNDWLYRFAFRRTSSILLSQQLYFDIKKYVNANRVYYCPYGIPNLSLDYKKTVVPNDEMNCNLLFLSNMMAEKGVYILLKACKLLKDRDLKFECHFVGAWHDVSEEDFDQEVKRRDIGDHVFAHGRKYNQEKVDYYRSADIFVFPTFYNNEAFPLVLLEAMQFELPTVTTNEGGIADLIVDNITGFLVQKRDVNDLADKIEFLIKHPEIRKEMGVAGKRRFMKLYTLDRFESNMTSILKKIV